MSKELRIVIMCWKWRSYIPSEQCSIHCRSLLVRQVSSQKSVRAARPQNYIRRSFRWVVDKHNTCYFHMSIVMLMSRGRGWNVLWKNNKIRHTQDPSSLRFLEQRLKRGSNLPQLASRGQSQKLLPSYWCRGVCC